VKLLMVAKHSYEAYIQEWTYPTASEEPEYDEHIHVRRKCAGDREDQVSQVTSMVDIHTTVKLAERCNQDWAKGEAKEVAVYGQRGLSGSQPAKDSTNTETTNVAVISEVESKSFITSGTPGAKNDDPSGVRRVRADRTPMFSLTEC
jgi:hypothetical protein